MWGSEQTRCLSPDVAHCITPFKKLSQNNDSRHSTSHRESFWFIYDDFHILFKHIAGLCWVRPHMTTASRGGDDEDRAEIREEKNSCDPA